MKPAKGNWMLYGDRRQDSFYVYVINILRIFRPSHARRALAPAITYFICKAVYFVNGKVSLQHHARMASSSKWKPYKPSTKDIRSVIRLLFNTNYEEALDESIL
jgi:hypothetical protein